MCGNALFRCTLAMAVLAAGTVVAWGQQEQLSQPYLIGQEYQTEAYQTTYTPAATSETYLTSTNAYNVDEGQGSLEDEVAALRAWQQEVLASQASAKKKAAGKPSFAVGGRFFLDTAIFDQNARSVTQSGDATNGLEARAAWFYFKGKAFEVVDYKFQLDLAAPAFKDLFITINELPVLGHLRVGHFKEPFSMEQLEASKYTTFMERSLGDSIFVPGRNMGVMAFNASDDLRKTWAIGAFAAEQGDWPLEVQEDSGNTAVTMRGTFLPWYDEATEGRGLLHTGVAYSYRTVGDDTIDLHSGPEAHLGPEIIGTGDITVPNYQLLGAEAALVYGAFSVQTEYFGVRLNNAAGADSNLHGFYTYCSYFLTGENRVYNRTSGAFNNSIKPFENFFRVRDQNGCVQNGIGAWELAYRYSYVDLDDGIVTGGQGRNHTFGVNWYLNPYTRMMFNYIHSTADQGAANDGIMNIVQMRAQMVF